LASPGGGPRAASRPDAKRRQAAALQTYSALEYDFVVKPGTDPSHIHLAFEGADRVRVADGDLILTTPAGDVRLKRPYAYQTINGRRVQVACDYRLRSPLTAHHSPSVAVRLAKYDASRPLVVDPTLEYSTYLGGSFDDGAFGIRADASGAVYLSGFTGSDNFPTTPGSFQPTKPENWNAFVTKIGSTGSSLVYSTYLGGSQADSGMNGDIAVDSSGHAYVTGNTSSTDFPVTVGAYQTYWSNPGMIAFVTKLSADGSSLVFSTFLGSGGDDQIPGITADSSGAVYAGGWTNSTGFPTTPGAFQTVKAYGDDAFFVKLNANGTDAVYSTFVGGNAYERTYGGAIDGAGGAYLTGYTGSTDFPVTPGAFQTTFGGLGPLAYGDAFVTKFQFMEEETALAAGSAAGRPGETVALTAALTVGGNGLAAKKVFFSVEGTAAGIGVTDDNGQATFAFRIPDTLGDGDRTIEALFPGADGYHPSSATATLTVARACTSLYALDRTGTITEAITLRSYLKRLTDNAWVVGRAVDYEVEGSAVGSGVTDANGRADCPWVITDGTGSRTILAEFAGDAAYLPSSDSAALTCQSWSTKMATFDRTARITDRTELKCRLLRSDDVPLYNKTVSFYVDGSFIIARPTDVQGYAKYPYYTVPDGAGEGTRTILSEWPGNGGYAAISKTATLTVNRAIAYIWVLPKTIPQGAIANLYAYFRRLYDYQKQTSKTVDFKIDGTVVQTVITDGSGVGRYLYPTTEPPGVYTIRCEFYGDAIVEPGYGEANLTIY